MTRKISNPPAHLDQVTRNWMNEVKNAVEEMQSTDSHSAPRDPENLTVTPQAGGNTVQFSLTNAASYKVFKGNTPDFTKAQTTDLGRSNVHNDVVGRANVKRYYWVQGVHANGKKSNLIGPATGTTLELNNANVATAPAVPQGDQYLKDSASNTVVIKDQAR